MIWAQTEWRLKPQWIIQTIEYRKRKPYTRHQDSSHHIFLCSISMFASYLRSEVRAGNDDTPELTAIG